MTVAGDRQLSLVGVVFSDATQQKFERKYIHTF